jgi:hypothetical protein
MSIAYNSSIVTTGIVLYFDAANPRSAQAGSGVWNDISGYNSVVTMSGSPSLTTLGGAACYRFTAAGQKFTGTSLSPQPTADMTIECWVYPEAELQADDRGCMLLLNGVSGAYMSWNKSTAQLSNYWYTHPSEGYWESGAAVSRNTWCSFTSVWNNSTSSCYQYTNGVKTTASPTVGNSATGAGINIGQEGAGRQFAGGISFIRVYNRALTDTEVTQNFTALRSRYGV